MLRLGLCCIFKQEPIKFKRTTAKYTGQLQKTQQLGKIAALCLENAQALLTALKYCRENQIDGFRINSQILPLKTHPECGYAIEELPDYKNIVNTFKTCGKYARANNIRTTFHPDQFILLSSPEISIVEKSIRDLIYQAEVANWVHADVINIHAGGAYGDKPSTLKRLRKNIDFLPESIRSRLTLENDDRIYSPEDILPLCSDMKIPFVYDIHHHRCLNSTINIEKTTKTAVETWDREPLFHISSPRDGWDAKNPRPHHDYINMDDFPDSWLDLDITVEVEAKAKELAILKLQKDLQQRVNKQ